MTQEEFFQTFRNLHPSIRMMGDMIRIGVGRVCPIAFVCNALQGTRFDHEMYDAGYRLGMTHEDIYVIYTAADNKYPLAEKMVTRQRLLGGEIG